MKGITGMFESRRVLWGIPVLLLVLLGPLYTRAEGPPATVDLRAQCSYLADGQKFVYNYTAANQPTSQATVWKLTEHCALQGRWAPYCSWRNLISC